MTPYHIQTVSHNNIMGKKNVEISIWDTVIFLSAISYGGDVFDKL